MAHPPPRGVAAPPDVPAWVEFLRRPENYPQPTGTVEVRETHMSWVFLTEHYAYKGKKPAHYPFLDFSTAERRRHNCEEEVRLNRRLAPDTYLGVVALTRDPSGRLTLEGDGTPVEWLVKMRRLPDACLLDRAITARRLPAERLAGAARRLADFYRDSPTVAWTADDYRRRLADRIATHCTLLASPHYRLPVADIEAVCAWQRAYLAQHAALIGSRVTQVREAHGDLRPEHICLEPVPVFIDCLEFNREFRLLDPVDELSFLAMECARLGDPGVGEVFFDAYRASSGDVPPPGLVRFYQSLWAMLRARLSAWHLDDPALRTQEKWSRLARDYLARAAGYARGTA
jgi:aminoglycoside phosphotransferase family enzyme